MNEQKQTHQQIRYNIEIGNEIEICSLEENATIKDMKRCIGVTRHVPMENLVILRKIGDDLKVLMDKDVVCKIDNKSDSITLRCLVIKENRSSPPCAYQMEKTFIFPQIEVLSNHGPWQDTQTNAIKIRYDDFHNNLEICTFTAFKKMIEDRVKIKFDDYLFLYVESSTEKTVITNTFQWMAILNDYGYRAKTLNVKLGKYNSNSSDQNFLGNHVEQSNFLLLPFIKIITTQGKELACWHPNSKNCDSADLMKFIERELKVPIQYQVMYHVMYHGSKKLSQARNLTSLLFSNITSTFVEIRLAYKTFSKSHLKLEWDEEIENRFVEMGLQKLRSVEIKDIETNISVAGILHDGVLNPPTSYREIIDTINNKLGQTFVFILYNRSGELLPWKFIFEELFYDKSDRSGVEEFIEKVELKSSLIGNPSIKPDERLAYEMRIFGFKKLVIKSLTKVIELDVLIYNTIDKLRRFIESEWKIPKHCQVYMTKDRKIEPDSNESLLTLYEHSTTEEERKQNALYFNLITLEPNNVTVYLNCPYGEKIGMPETVDILETSTVKDLENRLSEMMNIQISVFPRNPPDQYDHDEYSLPKDRVHLYSLFYSGVSTNLHLNAFRSIKAFIHVKCRKCGKNQTLEKQVTIKGKLNAIQDEYTIQDAMDFLTQKYQEYHCSSYGFCQRQNLKLSEKDNILNLTSESTLADLPVDYVLNFKTFCSFNNYIRGAFNKK
uniref:Ubiquitin-like domain-containing protein n=1 Tax=Clytia hemisphaerica TaxID=252671 RepID=A0A7M5WQJ7_9CNID